MLCLIDTNILIFVALFPNSTSAQALNDRSIVDCILTGDKDFLDSGISCPKMITAATFMAIKYCD